jgi:phosphatidylglycerophosphate synthase
MRRRALRTLPTFLSLSRFVLAAAFPLAVEAPQRVALLGSAAATDLLDGWIARRTHSTSRWGALVDPIADRVFALVAVATFVARGELAWGECLVLLARDIATALGFLLARAVPGLRGARFQARRGGKVVTALQFLTFLAVIVAPAAVRPLIVLVGLAAVWAIADYALVLRRGAGP